MVKNPRSSKYAKLIGQKFGFLTVVAMGGTGRSYRKQYIECKCDCGNTHHVQGNKLINSVVRSCGCQQHNMRLQKRDYLLSAKKLVYSKYKSSAKIRKIPFLLAFEEFMSVITMSCHYCDGLTDIANHYKSHKKTTMKKNATTDPRMLDVVLMGSGVDRIDSKEGYKIDNVVPCCTQCNTGKLDYTVEEFYEWIDRINKKRGII